jgi:hypothetical protein
MADKPHQNQRVVINEGTLKKNLNPPPTGPRPAPPKAQVAAPKAQAPTPPTTSPPKK